MWNAVFDVRAAGARFLLRLHSPDYHEPEAIAAELTWLAALHEAGLPAPFAHPTLSGEGVLRVDDPAIEHRAATLLGWIEGRRVPTLRPATFHALGRLMATLHAHAPSAKLRRPTLDSSTMRRNLFRPHDRRAWRGLDPRTRHTFTAALDRLEHVERTRPPHEVTLIHADLHAGNLLHTRGGLAPIDFDDCGYGSILLDLAVPLASQYASVRSPEGRALVAGYRAVGLLTDAQVDTIDVFVAARAVWIALFVRGWTVTHGGPLAARTASITEAARAFIASLESRAPR